MTNLIERIQDGDVSRDTGNRVLRACGWRKARSPLGPGWWRRPDGGTIQIWEDGPNPLASLDAAVALVESTLPQMEGRLRMGNSRPPWAGFQKDNNRTILYFDAPTLPAAVCVLLLKAIGPKSPRALEETSDDV